MPRPELRSHRQHEECHADEVLHIARHEQQERTEDEQDAL